MSDRPLGPGWWQASDGRWYPPESHPGAAPAPSAARTPSAGTAPLLIVKSHDEGRNADVALYPDRIERVLQRSRVSLSRAKQDAEVIPVRTISSVQARKDGLVYTKVVVYASGNTIEFRLRHEEAQRFRAALTNLVVGTGTAPSAGASASAPGTASVADELRKLAELRSAGVLTDAEFQAQKARLLDG